MFRTSQKPDCICCLKLGTCSPALGDASPPTPGAHTHCVTPVTAESQGSHTPHPTPQQPCWAPHPPPQPADRGSRTHRPPHGSVVPVHGAQPGRAAGAGSGGAVGEGGSEVEPVAQVVTAAPPAGAGRGGLGGAGAAGAQRELSGGAGAGDALSHGCRCQGVHEGGFPSSCGENEDIFLPPCPARLSSRTSRSARSLFRLAAG